LDRYLLTSRESEVAKLLLGGYSNTEIAERLFVGVPTIKKHLSAIYDKAKVKSRAEFISNYKSL
jgi:DNA-binding NarL/FixJ family response regulator